MSIDFKEVYKDRIKQIDIDIRKAIRKGNWNVKKLLEAEKKELENKIATMR